MEIERSGGYYFGIGLCFDKQNQIDEAMLSMQWLNRWLDNILPKLKPDWKFFTKRYITIP